MAKLLRAIGLMSGTSLDGIDVALIDTDGEGVVRRGASRNYPYPPEFRARLAAGLEEARQIRLREQRPGSLAALECELTERHGDAVRWFLSDAAGDAASIDVIGFHGQTVLHRSAQHLTVQLGDGAGLARQTGIDVVHDLRAADVAGGGQGAPLVPVYHQALTAPHPERPIAVLNIGGVANLTWIGRDGRLIAFDTGPGNALIDDWMLRRCRVPVDRDGATAARGRVDAAVLSTLLADRFFAAVPPKSLDRNAFSAAPLAHLSETDGAATLTAFTAASIARARAHLPEEPKLWIVCGGGRKNRTLMAAIAGEVSGAVAPAEAAGLDGDAIEAEAWAYLAVRSLRGLPISFPGTTGVARPLTGGVLARGR